MSSPSKHTYVSPPTSPPPPNVLQPVKPPPSLAPGVALPTATHSRFGTGDAMISPPSQPSPAMPQQQSHASGAQSPPYRSMSPQHQQHQNQHQSRPQTQSLLDTAPPLPARSRTSSVVSSRASSPARSSTGTTIRGRDFHDRISHSANVSRSSTHSPLSTILTTDVSDDIRSLIIRGFSPVIGVFASADTDEMIRTKGFRNGLRELLQPFGENIPGKIVIRDSASSSRSWEDYAVRFVDLLPAKRLRGTSLSFVTSSPTVSSPSMSGPGQFQTPQLPPLTQLEQLLYRHIHANGDDEDGSPSLSRAGDWDSDDDLPPGSSPFTSPIYKLFLRRLLAANVPTPHEAFAHPVATVIAISSHTPQPLETLRSLYAHTNTGDRKPPPWMFPDYLRYYVLVHDEDHDDIAVSTALFDQMKRHFGLHCHLLRLRSTQCVVTDDDSIPVPPTEFMTAAEDIQQFEEHASLIDLGASRQKYLFDSDVTALRAFVRELVAQSVIPHMENRVALWNDQVASKRRGFSGKFMNLSRRWAGFGTSSRSSSFSGSGSGNYDVRGGFYAHDSTEAQLRTMADYAFMLRDYKLAHSTYELVRGDFSHDKAWRYYAGSHEMCAVSMLLNPLAAISKSKLEALDQLLDTASYSYLTRCSDTQNTLRTFLLGIELLKSRGGSAAEAAAKWAIRALDIGLLAAVQRILVFERVAACYASKTPWGPGTRLGTRKRKAGMWVLLAANAWLQQGRPDFAALCLEEGERLYGDIGIGLGKNYDGAGRMLLPEMEVFVGDLRKRVNREVEAARSGGNGPSDGQEDIERLMSPVEETTEKFDGLRLGGAGEG